ncbi:MAG: hypothetical protein ACYSU0_22760 [Planctomycetota bacterium]|jgi:hypothetical protein
MRTLRSVLGRSPAALIVIFAVCSAACANHAAIKHGNTVAGHLVPVDESDIEIVREHIEVTIEPSKKWTTTPMARVHVEYVLRNPCPPEKPDPPRRKAEQVFCVSAQGRQDMLAGDYR